MHKGNPVKTAICTIVITKLEDPDPLTLALWLKKQGKPTKKTRGFSLCGTPKSLEKKGKNAQRKEHRNKKQGNQTKKQGLEGQGRPDNRRNHSPAIPRYPGGLTVVTVPTTYRRED